MNCSEVRDLLPLLLYGDVPGAQATAIQGHLASCATCRREFAELQQIRVALDRAPAPASQVDLPRLFEESAARQARRARRWRLAAVAVCGLAAALLVVVRLRLAVAVAANQLVRRWA